MVSQVLPREIDATLSVELEDSQRAESFLAAYRLARDYIGAIGEAINRSERQTRGWLDVDCCSRRLE